MSVFDFPHEVDIFRDVMSRDKYAGESTTREVVYSAEPAWVQTASADEVTIAERRDMKIDHVVYFKRDLGLGTWHRILHGSVVYEVRGFQDASAGLAVVWKALVSQYSEEATA